MERTLAGEARMETYKDRIAGRKQVRERRRARIERGTGDVPEEPGNKNDEQVAVRRADSYVAVTSQSTNTKRQK